MILISVLTIFTVICVAIGALVSGTVGLALGLGIAFMTVMSTYLIKGIIEQTSS